MQPRRAHTAMLRWAKAPMARSTQNKTATSTRTPAADGSKRRERQSLAPARAIQALRRAVPLPQKDGGDKKKRAVDPRLLAEVQTAGNPRRRVLEVRRAAVEEEVGADVGAAAGADRNLKPFCELASNLAGGIAKKFFIEDFGGQHVV